MQNLNQQVVEEQEEEQDYDHSPRNDGLSHPSEQKSPHQFNEAED